MTIIQSNNTFSVTDITGSYEKLPVGVYMVKYNDRQGYHLIKKNNFELPSKLYGDHSIVDRWLHSWNNNSDKNMGILLSGIKGSGKTITAQKLCIDSNLPVIIMTEPYDDSDFTDFITNPALGKFILFIDEFEKVFPKVEEQKSLLSLMDGYYPTKIIFLLTVNTENINEYLTNRLNRIKYRKTYTDLDEDTINEVIEDLLVNKEHRESILQFFDKIDIRTFDLLINIIKEMNLFNQDALTCGAHLNLKSERRFYDIYELVNGKEYICNSTYFDATFKSLNVERNSIEYLPEKDETGKDLDRDFYITVDLRESKVERSETSITITDTQNNVFRLRQQKVYLVF